MKSAVIGLIQIRRTRFPEPWNSCLFTVSYLVTGTVGGAGDAGFWALFSPLAGTGGASAGALAGWVDSDTGTASRIDVGFAAC